MSAALAAGIGYHDLDDMSYREISETIEFSTKQRYTLAAYGAYHGALLQRARNFPQTMKAAFPTLFGRNERGGVDTVDWRECKNSFAKFAAAFNAQRRR